MDILVTGGAGFIGSHVFDKLQNVSEQSVDEIKVIVLDDLSNGSRELFHPGWNWLSVMCGIRMWWKMSFPGIISLQSSIPSVEIKSDTGLRLCRRYRIGYCTGIPPHRIPHNQRIDRN